MLPVLSYQSAHSWKIVAPNEAMYARISDLGQYLVYTLASKVRTVVG